MHALAPALALLLGLGQVPKPETFIEVARLHVAIAGDAPAGSVAALVNGCERAVAAAESDRAAREDAWIAAGSTGDEPSHDLRPAAALCQQALAEHPRDKNVDGALYLIGWVDADSGDAAGAIAAWDRLVALPVPSSYAADAQLRRGGLARDANDLAKARSAFTAAALGPAPLGLIARFELGRTEVRARRDAAAIAAFESVFDVPGDTSSDVVASLRDEAIGHMALVVLGDAEIGADALVRRARALIGKPSELHARVAAAAAKMERDSGDTAQADALDAFARTLAPH